jgi:hypothetical protein
MTLYDDLIEGAIDLHCHVDLEFTEQVRKREPETEWLPKAEAMGIRGVVLKSHWWPTVSAVPYILQSIDTRVSLWSSVTLNLSAGGPDPCIIEACAELGGKVVFLPTWSACNDCEHEGFSRHLSHTYQSFRRLENPRYSFLEDNEQLSQRGLEIIECCRDRDLVLASGHVSWQETLAFAKAAKEMGLGHFVFTHPLNGIIQAPIDAVREAAGLGAFAEVCWPQLAPGRIAPSELVAQMRAIGLDHVVASTDYFRPYSPNPPELFRMFLGMLHEGGLSRDEVKQVACVNPARVMGLD